MKQSRALLVAGVALATAATVGEHVHTDNTIPSINTTFEKAYTWSLPAIVGGIAF